MSFSDEEETEEDYFSVQIWISNELNNHSMKYFETVYKMTRNAYYRKISHMPMDSKIVRNLQFCSLKINKMIEMIKKIEECVWNVFMIF